MKAKGSEPGRQANGHAREDFPAAGESAPSAAEGEAAAEGLAEEAVAVDAAVVAELEAALENTRAELAQSTDRLLRTAAEFDNYRKRTEREKLEAWGRAQADIVARLLDAIDDLERVAHYADSTPTAVLHEGVLLVEKKLRTVLQAAGLERIEAEGEMFDPAGMEAITTAPAEHPEEEDVVADVLQPGYRFKGQLLRPARVRVKKYEA